MKIIIFVFLFVSTLTSADEGCLFPPCPPPPTESEIVAVDSMLIKVKYILGAAYRVKNNTYKNIPEFVNRTKKLKQDIATLHSEAKQLNVQAGGLDMAVAIDEIRVCISSFNYDSIQFCHQALNGLKTYF
ncbi:MAG: hypothetical protein O7D86_02380 [Proteobacteria bacterium]|nr:hypothetical protein [Pseudomonadota bacterium]